MSSQPDLPSHVQRIVDEIENEIGDEPNRPASKIEGIGSDGGHGANGRVEAAVAEVKGLDHRPDAAEMATLGGVWRPWRSVAARLFWHDYLARRGRPG